MENSLVGKFLAKITDYGVSDTKAGNPQVFVRFAFQTQDGQSKELTWYGSFVGGAKDITLKALIACGMNPNTFGRMIEFNNGPSSGLLDMNKPLEIDVQQEPHHSEPGKMVTRIAWVNDPENPTYTQKRLSEAENAQKMGGMRLDGDFARLWNEMGFGSGQSSNQTPPQNNGGGQYQTHGQNQTQMPMNNGQQMPPQNNNQNFQQQNNGYQQNQGGQQGQAPQNNGGGFNAPF